MAEQNEDLEISSPGDDLSDDPETSTREDMTLIEDAAETSPEDERVAALIAHTIDVPVLAEAVAQQEAADAADTLEDLEEEEAVDVLEAMDEQIAAEALAEMEEPLAVGVVDDLVDEGNAQYAGRLLDLMAPDDAADLLQSVEEDRREQLYAAMPMDEAVKLRRLVAYEEDTAAGLMTTEFLALSDEMTVAEATETIRAGAIPEEIHHLPVVDHSGCLAGVIGLRALLINSADRDVSELMDRSVKAIRADLDQEEVAREFDRYDYFMLPVIDRSDALLGVVTVDDVIDIIREEQTEDVQKTVGAGAGEAVYSGVLEKFRGRFPWLAVSFVIMVPAAWVVLQFEWLIGELAILAVLMPVIAALAGNAGHQALAVTLRGIVLDEVRPDRVWPLVRRETIVGALNGLALGCAVGLVVALLSLGVQSASWKLGIVVAVSMTASMCAGTLSGSAVPLIMRRCGADPAQSSAIFLIMITDAAAFATFLGLAALFHGWLLAAQPVV